MPDKLRLGKTALTSSVFLMALVALAHSATPEMTLEIFGADWIVATAGGDDDRTPGHAFMCIAVPLKSGVKEDCYGFYSKSGGKGVIGGPGIVRDEIGDGRPTRFSEVAVSVKKKISPDQRKALLALAEKWNSMRYELALNNCIDFVQQVAAATGMKLPDRKRYVLPKTYVQALAALNP